MKTTNYENSKKLAEIGFKADTYFGYDRFYQLDYPISNGSSHHIKAYDLETLLEALPAFIELEYRKGAKNYYLLNGVGIGYADTLEFFCHKQQNESLADTTARLLILLHEKNIINFN